MGDEVVVACIILASASIVCKFIPNRLYADILSTLNFFCGVASLILTYNRTFRLGDIRHHRRPAVRSVRWPNGGKTWRDQIWPVSRTILPILSVSVFRRPMSSSPAVPSPDFQSDLFFFGVAFRLVRFVAVDKKTNRSAVWHLQWPAQPGRRPHRPWRRLVRPCRLSVDFAALSVGLMISHMRFAHFGRVILKQIPKPLFFLASAAIILFIAFIIKTKNVQMFGFLILTCGAAVHDRRQEVAAAGRRSV